MNESRERPAAFYMNAMREVAHALSASLDEAQVIDTVLDYTMDILPVHAALVRILSPDGNELIPMGARGLSHAYLEKGRVRLEPGTVDCRVLNGEVVILTDVTQDPGFQYPEEAAAEGLKGMVAVPMRVRARVIGVLRVYVKQVEDLSEADLLFLDTLADIGALALEKAHLHQSLYRIAQALNSSLELKTMLLEVLKATVEEMGLKAASIRLLDEKRKILRLVAAYGLSERYLSKGDVHVAKSPVDQRVLRGEAVVLYDVTREPGFEYPEEAAEEGIHSVLVVPLRLQDRTLGVMRAYSARPRQFSPVSVHFLTAVAHLVALAIEKAQLHAALQAKYEDLKLDLTELYRFMALG
ncbi:MAG: GAF domain-containing protein [Chloroflexi bacterium]|nr:GAF domain-containing protein [Chloroflexota bacterium]